MALTSTQQLLTQHRLFDAWIPLRDQPTTPSATTTIAYGHSKKEGRKLLNTRLSRFLVCPLLPLDKPKHALAIPEEVWRRVLEYLPNNAQREMNLRMVLVCKAFKDITLPLLYCRVSINTTASLQLLRNTLADADLRWDHLRRIPYSTPGRWLISLDVSSLAVPTLVADTALTQLFLLAPLLEEVTLNPIGAGMLSRRALRSLLDANSRLRVLKGLGVCYGDAERDQEILNLLYVSSALEVLELVGSGFGDVDDDEIVPIDVPAVDIEPMDRHDIHLHLPALRSLSVIAIPDSPVAAALYSASLPSLRNLVLTSYHTHPVDDQVLAAQALGIATTPTGGPGLVGGFPGPQPTPSSSSSTSIFLDAHGAQLTNLTLKAPPDWPPLPFTPPTTILSTCPRLHDLALVDGKSGHGSSAAGFEAERLLRFDMPDKPHPLQFVTISRPDDTLLSSLEAGLRPHKAPSPRRPSLSSSSSPIANTRSTSLLPNLGMIRFTSVRWMKSTYSAGALNAGTSGGMRRWRACLRRFGVRVLDMDGRSEA
ncbi:hypothetical protein FRB94_010526 [Tulasnella sp. JGI-2019a]|nr:hypothetical protein FRB94_010526 [Tulasnella sp. JGI-2019a]